MPVEELRDAGCCEIVKPTMTRTRAIELIQIAKATIEFAEAKGVTEQEFCHFGRLCLEMQKLIPDPKQSTKD